MDLRLFLPTLVNIRKKKVFLNNFNSFIKKKSNKTVIHMFVCFELNFIEEI